MTIDLNQQYKRILKEYGIEPDYVEDLGQIKKIHSKQGTLALKKTKLPLNELSHFESRTQFLQYKSYGNAVPIYRTKQGSYFVFDEREEAYYLMPWLQTHNEENRNNHAFQFFKQLGELHLNTVREEKIKGTEIETLGEHLKNQWRLRKEQMEIFVEKCEEHVYMSPFELYFCTYFQEMMRALDFATRKLEEWQELVKEMKMIRTVFSHGKPSFQHLLYNAEGKGIFINFERSAYLSPIYDLLYFFYRSCKTYPEDSNDRFTWFQTYRNHFSLENAELTLFFAYLAFPENLYQIVHQYQMNKNKRSEIKHLQQLQRAYWQMKNIEYFLTQIMMFEEDLKQKEQQESQVES